MVDADTLQRWHQWASQARAGRTENLASLEDEVFGAYVDQVTEQVADSDPPPPEHDTLPSAPDLGA
jgi:hypothetical protein